MAGRSCTTPTPRGLVWITRCRSVRAPDTPRRMTSDHRTRWLALYVLCMGSLMIVLDSTIVNVALPSIRQDLGFSETSLAWVVNADARPARSVGGAARDVRRDRGAGARAAHAAAALRAAQRRDGERRRRA